MRNQAVLVEVHHVLLKREGGLYDVFSDGKSVSVSTSFVNFGLAQKRFQKQSGLKDV